ncbi:MAG: molybdopterin-dependent oxidoreductase, partial [Planctomycetes bacterium]|nr:molybdopterin-dependent oxidoreductase [Planctomycetota bacterium]
SLTPAVRLAAHHAGRKLLEAIADEKGIDLADLSFGRGEVLRKGKPMKPALPFRDACALLDEDVVEGRASRPVVDRQNPNYEGYSNTNAGVQMAEVEVDTETGQVRVTKMVAVQDCGKVINAMAAESQVRGGVIQGVSYALFERRVMDRQEGRMINADLESYKIAGPVDCPEI